VLIGFDDDDFGWEDALLDLGMVVWDGLVEDLERSFMSFGDLG
jgi:hypothetical protein